MNDVRHEPEFLEVDMALSSRTDLGEIKISDQIIEDMITDIFSAPDMRNKIWAPSKYSYKIGNLHGITDPGSGLELESSRDEEGKVKIEFSVIVRFGISIRKTTREFSDKLYESMKYQLGIEPDVIIINIAGVKSKQIARRNTRVIYKYDNEE